MCTSRVQVGSQGIGASRLNNSTALSSLPTQLGLQVLRFLHVHQPASMWKLQGQVGGWEASSD